MIIGNMKFDIDKNKTYTAEELVTKVVEQPYGLFFSETLTSNQPDWDCFIVKCKCEDKKDGIHVKVTDTDIDEEIKDMLNDILSNGDPLPLTEERKSLTNLTKKKNKKYTYLLVILREDEENPISFMPVIDKSFMDDAQIEFNCLLNLFIDKGINSSSSLRKLTEITKEEYKRRCEGEGEEFEDPFIIENEDNEELEYSYCGNKDRAGLNVLSMKDFTNNKVKPQETEPDDFDDDDL